VSGPLVVGGALLDRHLIGRADPLGTRPDPATVDEVPAAARRAVRAPVAP
jgi:hypothetical protein